MAKDENRQDYALAVIAQMKKMKIDIPGVVGVGVEHTGDVALAGKDQIGVSAGYARFAGDVVPIKISGVELTGEIPGFTAIPADAATDSGKGRIVIAVGAENGAGVEAQQV